MNDMPMFDDPTPVPQEAPGPKKPRPKPAKKRKVRKAAKVAVSKPAKKRRKRAAKRIVRVNINAVDTKGRKESHAGGRHSRGVYDAIGRLMGMNNEERSVVLDIVQGLTEGRSA